MRMPLVQGKFRGADISDCCSTGDSTRSDHQIPNLIACVVSLPFWSSYFSELT